MLELRNVTVRFGGVVPLNDVSLTFEEGVCGLIGPNGAGKTTLLNLLSGFAAPAAGSVSCDGTDLLKLRPHQRAKWGLRRTFQTEQMVPGLTVTENVLVAAEQTGLRSGEGLSVEEAIEIVELTRRAHHLASRLSTGERRLVEFARACVGTPKVVLLDEPGAGLDSDESASLGRMVLEMATRTSGLIVLIDHDLELVRGVCTSIAVLDFGRVIAAGETQHVLNDEAVRRAYLGDEDLS